MIATAAMWCAAGCYFIAALDFAYQRNGWMAVTSLMWSCTAVTIYLAKGATQP